MSEKIKYCWDTSVFLAWLKREASAPQADIDRILAEIHSGNAVLIVSVISYTEILRVKHTPKQLKLFDDFLKRSNVLRVDATFPIAHKAEQVRSRALTGPKGQQRAIKTADATIIATAILQTADVLHSMDDQLHGLSESAAVDGLKITYPHELSGQMALPIKLTLAPPKRKPDSA